MKDQFNVSVMVWWINNNNSNKNNSMQKQAYQRGDAYVEKPIRDVRVFSIFSSILQK